MLRTDVIRLINSGEAWVFVGAGASVDAGLPTWKGLVQRVLARIAVGDPLISGDKDLNRLISGKDYPRAFARMAELTNRPAVVSAIGSVLSASRPGELTKQLAQWPVRGYVTTNYEHLIEAALREARNWSGWIEVGNSPGEVAKAGGNAKNIVWHIHGSLERDDRRFYPVVTNTDYVDLYMSTSPLVQQLKSFLAQQRLIFVGFGFQDPDLLKLLEIVKEFSSPANPVYAFLGDGDQTLGEGKRRDLFQHYNVDVIPYKIGSDGSHDHLTYLLKVYGSFILKRSQKYGMPQRPCPSYAPETTALLFHNSLVLQHRVALPDAILRSLLRAQVASLLHVSKPMSRPEIVMALAERVRLIRKASPIEENDVVPKLIEAVLDELKSSGLVEGDDKLTLTLNGTAALREQAAHSSRLYAQFSSSLNSRSESKASNVDSAKRISRAVESFLKDCIDQRALGVAMVGAFGSRQQDYHIVAILQSLPDYMGQLSRDEAMFLTEIIQELLARPSEEERSYLGLALQARFSLNLIGQDPQLVATRMQELAKTLFLIDSTTLINLLARGCIGHNSAVFLMNRLKAVKAPCATTKLLVTEAAEHARWAIDHANGKAPLSSDMLLAATGRAGYSTNLFLDGYYTETASGSPTIGLFDYLDSVMGSPAGHTATDEVCEDRLEMLGIPASELENWKGFAPELWAEREKLRNEIAEVRIKKGTYTHERQTQAEAEALIIIENVRAGVFTLESDVKHAYFVSNTRILDKTTHQNTPITMRPAGVLQWLSTITTANADELASLTNSILWELCERGFQVVDTAMLQQTFNPLLSASREHLQEEVAKLNNLTAVEYGESAKKAFEAMSDLELPVALNSAFAQQTRLLEEQARKSSLAATAAQKSRLSEEERMEYDRLKGEKAAKRTRARGKSRSHRRKKKAGGRS